MNEKLRETFVLFWDGFIEMIPRILVAGIVLFVFFLFGHFLFKFLKKRHASKRKETIVSNFATNALKWFFYLLGLIAALDILNLGTMVSGLIAGAGITAIILGFAFKDIGENFLAGTLLAVNRPFRIGNIIEVSGHKGVVKGMDIRTTHIRNVEGKDIFVPNAMIIKNIVVNYTKDGLLRQEFSVGLDVSSNVSNAKELILQYLSRQPEVLRKPEANVVVSEIGEFTINVKVLFWVDILKAGSESPSYLGITIRSKIIHEVKDVLLTNGFNLPCKVLEHKNYDAPIDLTIKKN
ncbi:MAG: mechanosensitive ion channel family protein [Bacteroidetes bacterium]|nr:MAG: mechanosensitive ion channel family protein [Bacteroidota bacterium]